MIIIVTRVEAVNDVHNIGVGEVSERLAGGELGRSQRALQVPVSGPCRPHRQAMLARSQRAGTWMGPRRFRTQLELF